jgi:putative tricarboxylic transport membrane protein
MMLVLGVIFGLIIGVLPGLSVTMGIAVLTPITFGMSFECAMAMLLGCFAAGSFGGSITAIVANIPGTNAAVVTTLDGYPMGKKGLAGKAIGIAAVSSFIGGLISCVFLSTMGTLVADFAMDFSAQEYFAVALFGISIMSMLSKGSMIKALISGLLGILLTTVGCDPITAYQRFTFGSINLLDGIGVIPILLGCFGVAEIMRNISKKRSEIEVISQIDKVLPTKKEFKFVFPSIICGSLIGLIIGIMPAAGGTIAAVLSYGVSKRLASNPDTFGQGDPRGVASPEAANNGSIGGAMIPMLTLGVPGDAITAILLSSLYFHGLNPGPMLFVKSPASVSTMFILLLLATLLFAVLGLATAKLFCKAIRAPMEYLMPIIALLCCVGTYCIKNSTFDLLFLIGAGVLGYIFFKGDIPVTPLILGLVLGRLVETNFRKILLISRGDFLTVFTRPISGIFMGLTVLMLFMPLFISFFKKITQNRKKTVAVTSGAEEENDFDNEME